MTIFREEFDSLYTLCVSFIGVDPFLRDEIGGISSLLFHISWRIYKFHSLLPVQNGCSLKGVLLHSSWLLFTSFWFGSILLSFKMIPSHILILLYCLLLIFSGLNYFLRIVLFHPLVNSPRPFVVFVLRVARILSHLFDISLLLLFRDSYRLLLKLLRCC